jgi:hypothetical protein
MTTTPSPTPTSRYALQAERKMGEMLLATERAKPPNPKPPKDRKLHAITDDPPTLAALGLSKRESAAAQRTRLLGVTESPPTLAAMRFRPSGGDEGATKTRGTRHAVTTLNRVTMRPSSAVFTFTDATTRYSGFAVREKRHPGGGCNPPHQNFQELKAPGGGAVRRFREIQDFFAIV